MKTLAIAYRTCPFGRPNKLEFVRRNLVSLRRGLGNIDAVIFGLLDRCPHTYFSTASEAFMEFEGFYSRSRPGNGQTFVEQIEILAAQEFSDLVYFAEDDYIYEPEAIQRGVEFMRCHPGVDAITLADHPDYRHRWVDRLNERPIWFGNRTWHRRGSTALTFMMRRQSLIDAADVLKTFAKGNSDLGCWLALTKFRVANPWALIRGWGDGIYIPGSIVLAWWYCRQQILHGRSFILYSPQPGLATHIKK